MAYTRDSIQRRPTGRRRALLVLLAAAPIAGAQAPANLLSLNAQLLAAARAGDVPAVRQVLARGAAPDSRNREGKTALLLACEQGQLALAATMLEVRADVDLAAVNLVTPLMAASHGGHVELVRRLLAAGARTDPVDRLHKPAIVYAAGQGHAEIVALLLDHGVAVDGVYANRLTALMWAAGQGHADVVRLLLARGADPSLRDDRGLSAAEIARDAGKTATADLLPPP